MPTGLIMCLSQMLGFHSIASLAHCICISLFCRLFVKCICQVFVLGTLLEWFCFVISTFAWFVVIDHFVSDSNSSNLQSLI